MISVASMTLKFSDIVERDHWLSMIKETQTQFYQKKYAVQDLSKLLNDSVNAEMKKSNKMA